MSHWHRKRHFWRGLLIVVSLIVLVGAVGLQLVWLVLTITGDVDVTMALTALGVAYLVATVHGALTRWSH